MDKQKHRLKLSHKIGHGAFGDVFKGSLDGETVAIKTIAEAHQGSAEAQGRLLREARMLQSCNHNNIISFRELCRLDATKHHATGTGGKWALVIEYAKGGTLMHKVSQHMTSINKIYTDAQALKWALEIAGALEYLHLRNPAVFHRDVKLSNIMLAADTDGQVKAVLTDFGLHAVADDTHRRQLRTSSLLPQLPPNVMGQLYQQPQPSPCPQSALPEMSTPGQQQPVVNDSAYQQQSHPRQSKEMSRGSYPQSDRISSESNEVYNEVHVHGHKRSFVTAGVASPFNSGSSGIKAEAAVQDERPGSQPDKQRLSKEETATPDNISAAMRRAPVARKPSFRKAAHHPGDQAAPRVSLDMQQLMVPASSAQSFAAGNPWGEDLSVRSLQRFEIDSICSFATDATWDSLGGWDAAVSTCGSDDEGSIATEVEVVFNMTGHTGSSLYIAPEVFQGQPYNEKADVFSFGVVLYELIARCLIMFTELPTCSSDPAIADHYAAKVSQGYRPKQPKKMPPAVWELIAACWHQDPVHRPHMSEVVSVLQGLLDAERFTGNKGRSSTKRPSIGQAACAPAALAPAGRSTSEAGPPKATAPASQPASCGTTPATQPDGSARPVASAEQRHPTSTEPASAGCTCVIC